MADRPPEALVEIALEGFGPKKRDFEMRGSEDRSKEEAHLGTGEKISGQPDKQGTSGGGATP